MADLFRGGFYNIASATDLIATDGDRRSVHKEFYFYKFLILDLVYLFFTKCSFP